MRSSARALPLALALLVATPAFAFDWFGGGHSNSSESGCAVGCGVLFGLTFGLDAIIDVVDIVVLAQGDFISPGWSVVQGLWGVGHLLVGSLATAGGALGLALQAKDAGTVLALGLIALGEGILLIIVAITSTVRFFTQRRRHREDRHPAVPVASVSVDPRGGATALLRWQF